MTQTGQETTETIATDRGYSLAFKRREGKTPWVVFLGGFRSDMSGTKAEYLDGWCADRGQAYLRLDYSGHGRSGGRFESGSISAWTLDALDVLKSLQNAPCVLVGSSMGGWIMLRVALALSSQVKGLVGIAAAPDFTRDMISRDLNAKQRQQLVDQGKITLTSEYDPEGFVLTQAFIEDGERCCLLDRPIDIDIPVRLLQGCRDAEVPWQTALRLQDALRADDVIVQLLKNGDHRLSDPGQLELMGATLARLLGSVETKVESKVEGNVEINTVSAD